MHLNRGTYKSLDKWDKKLYESEFFTFFGCIDGRCLPFEMIVTADNLDFIHGRAGAEIGSKYILAILGFLTYASNDFNVRHDDDISPARELLPFQGSC